ncbi:hypothetical protein Hanom_Chr05g00456181 [Helianthus anomalus]
MSSGDHHENLTEEMPAELPPLKWPRATFDGLVQNLRFPENWMKRDRHRLMLRLDM